MDITFLGHASFKLKGKSASVVLDPYEEKIGFKFPKVEADIVCVTHEHFDHNAVSSVSGTPYVVRGPGEYEVAGVEIVGVGSFHDNKKGEERGTNTIYNIKIDKMNVCHLGDLGQTSLTDQQVEEIGNVDILLLPIGGYFTVDPTEANKIAAQLEPHVIVPMHYKDKDTKVDQLEAVDKFLKEIGKENLEPVNKFSISPDKFAEETQVVLMSKA